MERYNPGANAVGRSQISLEDNGLKFVKQEYPFKEGVELSNEEQKYLLPHFLMLLIGKPGSGKTTILKQLLTNPQMYKGKFDHIFLVSPSFAKMGLALKPKNMTSSFNLDWIYERIGEVNKKQMLKQDGSGKKKEAFINAKSTNDAIRGIRERHMNRLITAEVLQGVRTTATNGPAGGKKGLPTGAGSAGGMNADQMQIQMQHEQKKLSPEEQKRNHANVLFILDDVVADIKRNENNPALGQLIMNRRHLVHNGTISIMLVTQKYTLIPARIRSNANWLILFKLNPLDFENVYKDVITLGSKKWHEILDYVFEEDVLPAGGGGGGKQTAENKQEEEEEEEEEKRSKKKGRGNNEKGFMELLAHKKHDNLGIWVEFNVLFKNFKRLVV